MEQYLYKSDSRFKNHMRNLDNFKQIVESPKSWNSMGYICLKTTFLHLKHYLQIYLTLLSTDLWFGKWHEEYGKFSPEQLKVSKLAYWWDPFIKSRKSVNLKSTEKWCVMTMKNGAKFEEELTFRLEFDEFWPEHLKVSRIFILMDSFWAKYILLELKKVQRSYLSWNWRRMQNLERNRLVISKLT